MKTLFKTFALAAIATLAITGCIKHDPYINRPDVDPNGGSGQGHGGGGEIVTPKANARADWSVTYMGREDYVNEYGGIEEVERFRFVYKGTGRFIFRVISPEDFSAAYKNDEVAFFEYEAQNLGENGETFNANTYDVLFDRMLSGSWIGFMIELDAKGNATYDYAEQTFTIKEEVASEDYEKWLGDWRVSNGLAGYDITISHVDNNFLYSIAGWECGQAVSFQMDLETLQGEFWKPDGCLYIRSQYLGTYEDTDFGYGNVDEVFLGNIFDSNGLTTITDEGIDVAQMVMMEKDAAELRAMPVRIETNNGVYNTEFYSMQYYMWDHKNQEYHPYNSNAGEIKFPFTMTRLPGTRASGVTPVKRAATKESVHRGQPKVAQGARKSVAKKAVRIK